jgi:RNA polymerase sigma-70 factor (ECF subfamily)
MPPTAEQMLFETYLSPVLDVAYGTALHLTRNREDAEDLVQDAAVRAFRAFHTFTPGTNFKAWFLRIVTNLFLNRCAKRKRDQDMLRWESAEDDSLWALAQDDSAEGARPDAEFLRRLDTEQITAALGQLPTEYRTVCVLYFMDEFSYQEIAEMVGCPIGTVRSRLHRGRKVLQSLLRHLAEERGWDECRMQNEECRV